MKKTKISGTAICKKTDFRIIYATKPDSLKNKFRWGMVVKFSITANQRQIIIYHPDLFTRVAYVEVWEFIRCFIVADGWKIEPGEEQGTLAYQALGDCHSIAWFFNRERPGGY